MRAAGLGDVFLKVGKYIKSSRGFTLIELVMVTLMLSLLTAVAIPNFTDFRNDAKNSAVKGAVGNLRAAIAIAVAAIALKEQPGTPKYPVAAEIAANYFNATHPILNGTYIMAPNMGSSTSTMYQFIPDNKWAITTDAARPQNIIYNCVGIAIATILGGANAHTGWCYNQTLGTWWANSANNGGTNVGSATKPTENWY